MKILDPFDIALEKTTLIEASAGTGKTYTITTLYSRLIAEGYPVESILVVTFTEAAAAELKLRIRKRIHETLGALQGKDIKNTDALASFFITRTDLQMIVRRMRLALSCFDQAAIMTIHSFCLKALKENAFETNSLFDVDLVPDNASFTRQVSHDFFMTHVNHLDTVFLSYLNHCKFTPEYLMDHLMPMVSRPELHIQPSVKQFRNVFSEYRHHTKKIHDLLRTDKQNIITLLKDHKGLDKRSYSKRHVPLWINASIEKLNEEKKNTFFFMEEKGDALYKFSQTRLRQKLKKPEDNMPEHPLFAYCEQLLLLQQVFKANLVWLKRCFFTFFSEELEKMKQSQGVCFFDDLVNDLALALASKGKKQICESLRRNFKACLIDEFQDTDSRQYEIFSTVFGKHKTPFFMIGDPKQAIYAFRGGDIFAYLKAVKESERQYTLEKNYRSAPRLVQGINRLFSIRENPFEFEDIAFSQAGTPETALDFLVKEGKKAAPLQFSIVQREGHALDRQGYLGKGTAETLVPEIISSEILTLLHSNHKLLKSRDKRRQEISPKDIAVLVRTNRQAEQIQRALSKKGIPSCLSKTGSVFDSRQAEDIHDILWAVNSPDDKGLVSAALCTTVFNFNAEKLNEAVILKWQAFFSECRFIWETKGFTPMIMGLFHTQDTFLSSQSILDERALTNYYHLAELISQYSLAHSVTPFSLLQWFDRQLNPALRQGEKDELRLESEREAVSIITIHKSKGLEYPIVYLPYLWEAQQIKSEAYALYHDPSNKNELTLTFSPQENSTAKERQILENNSEQMRLLYVALTRASAMCRIIWGGFAGICDSALGRLIHHGNLKRDSEIIAQIESISGASKKCIECHVYGDSSTRSYHNFQIDQIKKLSAMPLGRSIQPGWKVSSFSAITQAAHALSQEKSDPKIPEKSNEITLAQFPKGADVGEYFHSIFETIDFTSHEKVIDRVIGEVSNAFGIFDPRMIDLARKGVHQILKTKLGRKLFCLKDIKPAQRFNELEFTFSVKKFKMEIIARAFGRSHEKYKTNGYLNHLSRLTSRDFKGFVKGFIDLVFRREGKWYIVDYKTNHLGESYDLYTEKFLFSAMFEHHYFLQYHFYLVALYRLLRYRLNNFDYDQDFGGVLYLFIRGMHPDFGGRYGVFFDRPSENVIEYLSDNL